MSKRMIPADRKASILEAAIVAAQQQSFTGMRMQHVSAAAECSNALVVSYFGTMTQLRRAVMRAAIKRELLPIIANGVATKDPVALRADPALQKKACATLTA